MASPPPPTPRGTGEGAVCCMCGDHGLTEELFRCRGCRARLQHTYCSHLYPRAAAYRRCNWCLRGPEQGGGRAGHAAAVVLAAGKTTEEPRRKTAGTGSSDVERAGCSPRTSRSPPELGGKPVKKKHKAEEKTPMTTRTPAASEKGKEEVVARDHASGAGSKAEVMRAGKTTRPPASRVKVRRYKLLAEVISC